MSPLFAVKWRVPLRKGIQIHFREYHMGKKKNVRRRKGEHWI